MNRIKWFLLLNGTVFALMPFWTYQGQLRVWKIAGYWGFVAFGVSVLWRLLSEFDLPLWTLAFLELGLCLHYLGGSRFGGERVYNEIVFGIVRYDKIVHFTNAFAGYFALEKYFAYKKYAMGKIEIALIVLGIGGLVEIIEYTGLQFVHSVVSESLYDNNMRDLVANFFGASLAGFLSKTTTNN